jgi:hypothetical protein
LAFARGHDDAGRERAAVSAVLDLADPSALGPIMSTCRGSARSTESSSRCTTSTTRRRFHAIYGEHEATVVIEDLEVLSGFLPTRALRLVVEWAELHGDELAANWRKAREHVPLDSIEPLT